MSHGVGNGKNHLLVDLSFPGVPNEVTSKTARQDRMEMDVSISTRDVGGMRLDLDGMHPTGPSDGKREPREPSQHVRHVVGRQLRQKRGVGSWNKRKTVESATLGPGREDDKGGVLEDDGPRRLEPLTPATRHRDSQPFDEPKPSINRSGLALFLHDRSAPHS